MLERILQTSESVVLLLKRLVDSDFLLFWTKMSTCKVSRFLRLELIKGFLQYSRNHIIDVRLWKVKFTRGRLQYAWLRLLEYGSAA